MMYLRCSTSTQKQVFENILSFVYDISFLVLMLQIFTGISQLEIKNFGF